MNINFGLFPPAEIDDRPPELRGKRLKRGDRKKARKAAVCARALAALKVWMEETDT